MKLKRFMTIAAAATAICVVGLQPSHAQDYPTKTVTVVVPFAAGGNTDTVRRLVAEQLDKRLGQRFIVENKPGAGGNIGLGTSLVRSLTAIRSAWVRSAPTRSTRRSIRRCLTTKRKVSHLFR